MGLSSYETAACLLPSPLRTVAGILPGQIKSKAEEFRLRVGNPMSVTVEGHEFFTDPADSPAVTEADLAKVVELASRGSVYSVTDEIKNGYIAAQGGHRVGVCGKAVLHDGQMIYIKEVSSVCIRIAREALGAADGMPSQLITGDRLPNTLIISPPLYGKTTFLRDMIRQLSDGCGAAPAFRVAVADERGELGGVFNGSPQFHLGKRTDILTGCPKAEAILVLLRSMAPQIIAVDEITAPEDIAAIAKAAYCGVSVLATAHADSADDLNRRPLYRRMLEEQVFRKLVVIKKEDNKRQYEAQDLEETRRNDSSTDG